MAEWLSLFTALLEAEGLTAAALSRAMAEEGTPRTPQLCGQWMLGNRLPGWECMPALTRILRRSHPVDEAAFYRLRAEAAGDSVPA